LAKNMYANSLILDPKIALNTGACSLIGPSGLLEGTITETARRADGERDLYMAIQMDSPLANGDESAPWREH
jgi:hypothetical protein